MPRGRTSSARAAWIFAAAILVFVLWLLLNSAAGPGVAFFYAVPVGLATWWFGRRAGVAAAIACAAIYLISALIDPVTNLIFALALRAIAFATVVVLVSLLRERLIVLEQSAEELEAIRASLTPDASRRFPASMRAPHSSPPNTGFRAASTS